MLAPPYRTIDLNFLSNYNFPVKRNNEAPISKTSVLQLTSRIIDAQVSETMRTEIFRRNYPALGGGYRRYPWYPGSAATGIHKTLYFFKSP
jgi:hypothetical protein